MSNKRIDLTQFEGITPTQWRVDYEAVGDIKTVLYVKSDMTAHGNFVITVLEDAPNGEYTEADANAIAAVPNLIAELKRCYEELDKWAEYATYMGNVDIHCHKDASAEAGFLWKCTDCGAHFELPENGIYECEFGCDASE